MQYISYEMNIKKSRRFLQQILIFFNQGMEGEGMDSYGTTFLKFLTFFVHVCLKFVPIYLDLINCLVL